MKTSPVRPLFAAALLVAGSLATVGQDRLKSMPGEDRYQKMAKRSPAGR